MTTKAHKSLTGADLHENKGAASAADNTVATATSGATVWKKLTNANLDPTGNPFGANLLHVRNVQPSGTTGAAVNAASFADILLNTAVTNEISGASLSSNNITLPSGTYFVSGVVPFGNTGATARSFLVQLYNVTDNAQLLQGQTLLIGSGAAFPMKLQGRFTLSGTKSVSVQARSNASGVIIGNPATVSGVSEVYTDVLIWKIA